MNYQFCTHTDPGQTRVNNEDSVAFDEETNVAVLADGMGGYNAGEIASGMATAFIKSELSRWLTEVGQQASRADLRRAIQICVDNANRSILNASRTNPQYAGMGTTLVVSVFQDATMVLGHIGDSRCYRLRDKIFQQITKDHSLLQEQIDAGLLTSEQAQTAPNKNLVTRALGVEDAVLLEINEHQVESGDTYLMCSDGLSDMMQDNAIAKIMQNGSAMSQMAADLVAAANRNGGRDNITVLLVQAFSTVEKRSFVSRLFGK